MDNRKRVYNENPKLNANLISKLFFCWISPLLTLGQKKTLVEEDLYKPLPSEETEFLTNKLDREWKKQLRKKDPSLFKAIVHVWIGKTLKIAFLPFLEESIRLTQPLLIRNLIKYFNGQINFEWAIVYGSLMCLNTIINVFTSNPFYDTVIRQGMQIRIAVCGLVYKKILKLNSSISGTESSGKILNLLTNDASRIETMFLFAPYLVVGPLQAIAIIVLLQELVDLSILSGTLLLILMIPLQSILGKIENIYRHKTSKITDERINLTSEVINGMKIIKLYCWEKPFKKMITLLRKKELNSQAILFITSALERSIDMSLSNLITFTSIAIFVLAVNKPLLTTSLVLIMAYNMRLSGSITYYFARAFKNLIAGRVSCKRVQELLLQTEISEHQNSNSETCSVYVSKLSASWNHGTKSCDKGTLESISFEVKEGSLLAVVGSVGSGKTSLLMALMGEMPLIKGKVKLNGSVFYVTQEPWIFPSTIKQNIIFGKEYSKAKFDQIIKLCALDDDLKMLPNGKNTMIGDKGVNLSGGQRSRISLARALYHDPDIYIFDDPMSAVDTTVAKHLFENCINGHLKSKIRIMVTHQLHLLTNADEILVIDDGKIQSSGKYNELIEDSKSIFRNLINNPNSERRKSEPEIFNSMNSDKRKLVSNKYSSKASIIEQEEFDDNENEETRVVGSISWNVYKSLFDSSVTVIALILVLILLILSPAAITLSNYWLSYWATSEEQFSINIEHQKTLCINNETISSNLTFNCLNKKVIFDERKKYFTIYTILFISSVFIVLTRSFAFYGLALLKASKLHQNALSSIMQANMRFFDTNPVGRIMNRFSKDIGNIDDSLPLTLFDFVQCVSIVSSAIVLAIVVNYWIIIPLIPLFIIFIYIRRYFVSVSREIKRIENSCRSPIYIHTSNTISGITTIRACNNQNILITEYNMHSDYHTQAYVALMSANRWFSIRLDIIVVIYTSFVVFGCVFARDFLGLTSGQVGLALVSGLQIMSHFQWAVRQSAEVENLMTSIERIIEFSNFKDDDLDQTDKQWSPEGNIEFNNVSFSYGNNLPQAFKNVSFKINSGEKIAVIGRTGSGKSSLFQALYRIAEPDGNILIDGLNIKNLSLNELRSKLSIIPQEPTLFLGTIRFNIDPLGLYDDKILWNALEIVQLKDTVMEMKNSLDTCVQKGGSNLSVGQKQLFCVVRAILKKSKILLVDEATSNVDFNTDVIVQKAIRNHFKECTVITIAHRLQTIMNSDKIICMSNGELVDYDKPRALLNNKNSILNELISKLSKQEQDKLQEIVNKNLCKKERE